MYVYYFVYCGRYINWVKFWCVEIVVNFCNYVSFVGLLYGEVCCGFLEVLDICLFFGVFVLDVLNFFFVFLKWCCNLFWFFEVCLVLNFWCYFDCGIMGM